jgi:hypothetical protein
VVGVFVDDDVVAVPEPVAAIADVEGADAEVETSEPEAVGAASGEMPDVAAAEASGEVAVFPGMIEVHAGIVTAGVVADPFAVGVNVRRVGMSPFVAQVRGSRFRDMYRSGAVGRNVSGAAADFMTLSKSYEGKQEAYCERSNKFSHVCSFSECPFAKDCRAGWRAGAIE